MLARSSKQRIQRGFTLVEMLIAMVLTLILVWAIAEFSARVGEAVKDNRAMIEQRGSLRSATQMLNDDLKLATAVPAPPAHDEVTPIPGTTLLLSTIGSGYLTIREGICSEVDPEGDGIDIYPSPGGNGIPDVIDDLNGNQIPDFVEFSPGGIPPGPPGHLGDIDDYIGLTTRSANDPFVAPRVRPVPFAAPAGDTGILDVNGLGQPVTGVETSMLAEVAWWTSFDNDPILPSPSPPANLWNSGEPRTLHRRLLLVRPELNVVHQGDPDYSGPYYFRVDPTVFDYYTIMQFGDVSIRPFTVTGSSYVYYFANSLADLTRRENRFLHVQGFGAFPNPLDLNPNNFGDPTVAPPPLPRSNPLNNFSQFRWVLGNPRRGEDVILTNVLAFDVRVFDATAVLRYDNLLAANATGTLQPGDLGYGTSVVNVHPIAGAGAFVDLWYNRYLSAEVPAASLPTSTYSGPPRSVGTLAQQSAYATAFGAIYDTWASSYERDGLNQDSYIGNTIIDQGTDGLDSDVFNGVDDKGEQETSPPYPTRLRGIEVMIRSYETGTRQVQQGTVGADFIPE